MPCNKTINFLIWREDLLKISPPPPSLLDIWPSQVTQTFCVYYILRKYYFNLFMFSIILKVSVRLVKLSKFHKSHLYYEKDWKLLTGVSLRVCEYVFLSLARCDPGSRDPNKPNVLSCVFNWFEYVFVLVWIYKWRDKTLLWDSVTR